MSAQVKALIEDVLTSSQNKANYPAGMVITLLRNQGEATKTEICKYLAKINNSDNPAKYRKVPVFKVNKKIQNITTCQQIDKDELYKIKYYQDLTESEIKSLETKAYRIAKTFEVRQH
jgi:hypothetical protein